MANNDIHDIHTLIKQFDELWAESLNGNYKVTGQLSSTAKKIEAMLAIKYYNLSNTEKHSVDSALIIAKL